MSYLIGGFGAKALELIKKKFVPLGDNPVIASSSDGLYYAVADNDVQLNAIPLGDQEGLLLGTIFDKQTYSPIAEFKNYVSQ